MSINVRHKILEYFLSSSYHSPRLLCENVFTSIVANNFKNVFDGHLTEDEIAVFDKINDLYDEADLAQNKSAIHARIQTQFDTLTPETRKLFNDYMHEYHQLGQEFESASGLTVSTNDINLQNPIIPKNEYQSEYSIEDFLSRNEVLIPSLEKYNLQISRYGNAKAIAFLANLADKEGLGDLVSEQYRNVQENIDKFDSRINRLQNIVNELKTKIDINVSFGEKHGQLTEQDRTGIKEHSYFMIADLFFNKPELIDERITIDLVDSIPFGNPAGRCVGNRIKCTDLKSLKHEIVHALDHVNDGMLTFIGDGYLPRMTEEQKQELDIVFSDLRSTYNNAGKGELTFSDDNPFERIDQTFDSKAAQAAIAPIDAYAFERSFIVYGPMMKGKAEFVPKLTEALFTNYKKLHENHPRAYNLISSYWNYNPVGM